MLYPPGTPLGGSQLTEIFRKTVAGQHYEAILVEHSNGDHDWNMEHQVVKIKEYFCWRIFLPPRNEVPSWPGDATSAHGDEGLRNGLGGDRVQCRRWLTQFPVAYSVSRSRSGRNPIARLVEGELTTYHRENCSFGRCREITWRRGGASPNKLVGRSVEQ